MLSVLAIDAAWTAGQPSGVALVSENAAGSWCCNVVAPSYCDFLDGCRTGQVNWAAPALGRGEADLPALLQACSNVTGHFPTLITLDMPVATQPINGRRVADNVVSNQFGGNGCSTHTQALLNPVPLDSGSASRQLLQATRSQRPQRQLGVRVGSLRSIPTLPCCAL